MAVKSNTAFQNDAENIFCFFRKTIDNKPETVYTIVTKKKQTEQLELVTGSTKTETKENKQEKMKMKMKMNVDELVTITKDCLNPNPGTCENCAIRFCAGCVDELCRRIDAFAAAYKSQTAEIEKLNETISEISAENESFREELEFLAEENDEFHRLIGKE